MLLLLLVVDDASEAAVPTLRQLLRGRALLVGYAAIVAAYLGLRWFLGERYGLRTPLGSANGAGQSSWKQWPLVPIGLFTPFKFWLVFAVGTSAVLVRRGSLASILNLVGALAVFIAAFSVVDFTRSMAYAFPAVLTCLVLYLRNCSVEQAERTVMRLTALNVAFPTLVVMTGLDWLYPLPIKLLLH